MGLWDDSAPVRIFLTPEQDQQVKASGKVFGIVHPTSYPASAYPGRHAIDMLPVSYEQAVQILAFIEGKARIQKIKAPKP